MMALVIIQGCTGIPKPAITQPVVPDHQIMNSHEVHNSGADDKEPISIVLKYIAESIEEKAGLRIVAVVQENSLPPQVIALPKKSEGLVTIWITELAIPLASAAELSKVRLSLLLAVFDDRGQLKYIRTASAEQTENGESSVFVLSGPILEKLTKTTLQQYLQDPTLRAMILKFKLSGLRDLFA
jgi:hypothetical protein